MRHVNHPIAGVAYMPDELADRYIASGAWHDATVGDALRHSARTSPDHPAFVSDERSVTLRELDEETERLAAALLALGLAPGDRVMCQLGTTVETVVALVACYKAGLIPVCAVPQYREIEIGQLASMSACRAYLVQADLGGFDLVAFAGRMMQAHPHIEHLVTVRGRGTNDIAGLIASQQIEGARNALSRIKLGLGDVLSFQLSGGTTGIPKIIPRFHAEYLGHSRGWMRCYRIDGDCRLIWSLPLIHNAGQVYALIPALLLRVTVVLMPRVDIARMLELVERHRVTHALSIGPVAPQLIAYADLTRHDLSSLRHFATMSRAGSLERHLGLPCSNLFGITEGLLLGTPASAPAAMRHDTQGYSGEPADEISLRDPGGIEVALGELGELCFRGPSSTRGYYNAPGATHEGITADGFVRTGDMMRAHVVDGRRHYAFEGRIKDNINRGGEKIGCEEVEAIVSRHPAVADAKLVPMPDPIYGERGCVYLIIRSGHAAPGIPDLIAFLSEAGLAKFKCPERIEIMDEFPTTRVGKLDKMALRKLIAEKLAHEDARRAPATIIA